MAESLEVPQKCMVNLQGHLKRKHLSPILETKAKRYHMEDGHLHMSMPCCD